MFIFSDFCVIHSILVALMSIPVFRALTPGPLQISIGLKMLSLTGKAIDLGPHEISMDLCRNKPNITYLHQCFSKYCLLTKLTSSTCCMMHCCEDMSSWTSLILHIYYCWVPYHTARKETDVSTFCMNKKYYSYDLLEMCLETLAWYWYLISKLN